LLTLASCAKLVTQNHFTESNQQVFTVLHSEDVVQGTSEYTIRNIFGRHLMSLNIPFSKEDKSFTFSLMIGGMLCLLVWE